MLGHPVAFVYLNYYVTILMYAPCDQVNETLGWYDGLGFTLQLIDCKQHAEEVKYL